jgi:uncharacterized membrane protein YoaK (UPF0700 family)
VDKPDLRLAALLSATAGAVDVIGLQRLGLFTAHITGNIVVIAAEIVSGGPPRRLQILAVPVFMIAVAATWLIANALERRGMRILRPLLIVQLLLIGGVLLASAIDGANPRRTGAGVGLEAMLAVSAMACQFATLRIAVPGAPSTAVMTGNLTGIVLSTLDVVASRQSNDAARAQLRKTSGSFLGFFLGCVAGAIAVLWLDGWAWALPCAMATIVAVVE